MKYVFRVLKKNYETKEVIKGNNHYYNFPIIVYDKDFKKITYHILLPKQKTYINNDYLYFKLDSKNYNNDIILDYRDNISISENKLLNILKLDYLVYFIKPDEYNPILPHAMNNYAPIGENIYNEEHDSYYLDKWGDVIDKINSIYPNELTSIDPFTCDNLYPFHFNKFSNGEFIREYRSNIMMFMLSLDSNFIFTDKENFDNHKYIYYKLNDKLIPVFKLLKEKEFYDTCLSKDIKNRATTPFLKSFNDHGFANEIISFINEDDNYKTFIENKFNELRTTMDENLNNKKKYLIASLDQHCLNIQHKIDNNEKVTSKEILELETAKDERIKKFVKLYDQNKLFYMSSEDILNQTINTPTLEYINKDFDSIEYNRENDILYGCYPIDESKETCEPILEAIDKHQLDEIKQKVYDKWIKNKLEETTPKKR